MSNQSQLRKNLASAYSLPLENWFEKTPVNFRATCQELGLTTILDLAELDLTEERHAKIKSNGKFNMEAKNVLEELGFTPETSTFLEIFATKEIILGEEVEIVSRNPLSFILKLPDGCTSGRWEAAEAFAEIIAKVRTKYPTKNFTFLPFSFKTCEGKDPAVTAFLAV